MCVGGLGWGVGVNTTKIEGSTYSNKSDDHKCDRNVSATNFSMNINTFLW